MDYRDKQIAAVEQIKAELAKPIAQPDEWLNCDEEFDPWALFPCLYGSYSSDFDEMAITVLQAINLAAQDKWDEAQEMQRRETLAHQMFREMLCTAELCDYGTSPRVCFATSEFAEVLPSLVEKWQQYSDAQWLTDAPPS